MKSQKKGAKKGAVSNFGRSGEGTVGGRSHARAPADATTAQIQARAVTTHRSARRRALRWARRRALRWARPPRQSGTRWARRRALRWARPPRQLGTRWAGKRGSRWRAAPQWAQLPARPSARVSRARPRRARQRAVRTAAAPRTAAVPWLLRTAAGRGGAARRGAGRGGAGRGGAGADRGCSVSSLARKCGALPPTRTTTMVTRRCVSHKFFARAKKSRSARHHHHPPNSSEFDAALPQKVCGAPLHTTAPSVAFRTSPACAATSRREHPPHPAARERRPREKPRKAPSQTQVRSARRGFRWWSRGRAARARRWRAGGARTAARSRVCPWGPRRLSGWRQR